MATKPDIMRLSKKSQTSLLTFVSKVVEVHNHNHKEMVDKMDVIDRAYARYVESQQMGSGGVDVRAGDEKCDVFGSDRITPPLVVSQVDSFVGYLAEVFLSGYPLFPVVGTPATKKWAEQLETLLDDHAQLGGYARQLLMFLRDGCKYNLCAMELDWDVVNQFSALHDFTSTDQKLQRDDKYFNRATRIDPRNLIRDTSVLPGDIAESGDYVGKVERITMTKLKRLVLRLQKEGRVMNAKEAFESNTPASVHTPFLGLGAYSTQPVISEYITSNTNTRAVDWDSWFEGSANKGQKRNYGATYEKVTLYARIMPADHEIPAVQRNTPQIWKLIVINGVLLSAYRIVTAYDYLPILVGQPIEDGFGEQTQSIGEAQIPFQEAATTLFGIRFSAARRAVSDRALYNSNYISAKQANNPGAAPKIPVNLPAVNGVSFDNIYKQIPFDLRGTETALQDAQVVTGFGQQLSGLNNSQQGMFQKGNKSVAEWTGTMDNSENRMRLPALSLEHQVFGPMKSLMALNIMMFGEDAELVSQKTGDIVKVDIKELRKHALSFRIADGYTPKSKLASADTIAQGLQLISQSPVLQEAYGKYLPGMFAHMMQLAGVRGLEEYDPMKMAEMEQTNAGAAPLQNIGAASLQPTSPPAAGLDPAAMPPNPAQQSLP